MTHAIFHMDARHYTFDINLFEKGLPRNTIVHGDCLGVMGHIPSESVCMVLCDLPFGITSLGWDIQIPLDKLWTHYNRIVKKDGVVCLFSRQPFTTGLINSNPKHFKQELIWNKGKGSNPLLAKKRVMQAHENILLFCRGKMPYSPQFREGTPYKAPRTGGSRTNSIVGSPNDKEGFVQQDNSGFRYPLSVLDFSIHCGSKKHPTEKPVELLEYLIKTYSNEGDLILDNAAGSGSTGEAAWNTKRDFILIEKERKYYDIIIERLKGV